MQSRHRAIPYGVILAACAAMAVMPAGCDRNSTAEPGAVATTADPATELLETFHRLRGWYAQGAYRAIGPHLDPKCSESVIDLLVVVDELLAANHAAQDAIRRACPTVEAKRFDMSTLAENLELFSRDVRVIRSDVDGDKAVMTTEIAGRLPLVRLQFHRLNGRWVYMPGYSNTNLIPVMREMAGALNRIALVVSSGPQTPGSIENEYQFRITPKLRRISDLAKRKTASQPEASHRG